MNNPTTLYIPSLDPVLFTRSPRARHLSITVKPDQTVKVTIPQRISLPAARKFLQSKIPWVKKNLNKLQKLRQNYPRQNLLPVNKKEAKTILTDRINLLAQKYKFSYNRLYIRNQKTRWGSCSAKNNISLNGNLISLPQKLQDYVILHELVHTEHKNHSKKFWAEMDRLVGDGKMLRKEIREYRLEV